MAAGQSSGYVGGAGLGACFFAVSLFFLFGGLVVKKTRPLSPIGILKGHACRVGLFGRFEGCMD